MAATFAGRGGRSAGDRSAAGRCSRPRGRPGGAGHRCHQCASPAAEPFASNRARRRRKQRACECPRNAVRADSVPADLVRHRSRGGGRAPGQMAIHAESRSTGRRLVVLRSLGPRSGRRRRAGLLHDARRPCHRPRCGHRSGSLRRGPGGPEGGRDAGRGTARCRRPRLRRKCRRRLRGARLDRRPRCRVGPNDLEAIQHRTRQRRRHRRRVQAFLRGAARRGSRQEDMASGGLATRRRQRCRHPAPRCPRPCRDPRYRTPPPPGIRTSGPATIAGRPASFRATPAPAPRDGSSP